MKQIISDNIVDDYRSSKEWNDFIDRINERLSQNGKCTHLAIELTPCCTLKCKMCYVRLDREEVIAKGDLLPKEAWLSIAKQFREAGGISILLTGGEAITHPQFYEIYEELSHMGFFINLFTNGTTITDKIYDLFKRRPPSMLALTFYGASNETYEKLCGMKDGFDRTLAGLDRLLTIPNLKMDVRFTIVNENYKELEKLYDIVAQRGKFLNFDYGDALPVRGAKSDAIALRLSKEQKEEVEKFHARVSKPIITMLEKAVMEQEKESDLKKMEEESITEVHREEDNKIKCRAGLYSGYIAWDGKMYGCSLMPTYYTLPLEDGFLEAFRKLKEFRNEMVFPAPCVECIKGESCKFCLAKAITEIEYGTDKMVCSVI